MNEQALAITGQIAKELGAVQKQRGRSLFQLSDDLQALRDSIEMLSPEDEETRILAVIEIEKTKELQSAKIDQCAFYVKQTDKDIENLKEIKKELELKIQRTQAHLDKFRELVTSVVVAHAPAPTKTKSPSLQGNLWRLAAQSSGAWVSLDDPGKVPNNYCRFEVKLKGPTWAKILQCLPADLREVFEASSSREVSISTCKAFLEGPVDPETGEAPKIPGVSLRLGNQYLRIY